MSTRDENQLVLDAIGNRRPNSKNIIRANCPFCETVVSKVDRRQCLSINASNGFYKCYRCESDGRLRADDMPTIGTLPQAKPILEPVKLPESFTPLWTREGEAIVCKPAVHYVTRARPVADDVLRAAKIGCCWRGWFARRIVVPIYKEGKLVGYVGRYWKKKPPEGVLPYLYSKGFDRANTLYNEDALYVTTEDPVIIVEGVFDTFPFWPNACAMLGKLSAPQVEMLMDARRPILLVFDGDAHRQATAMAMALRMRGKRAAALRLEPGVDPDEVVDLVKTTARTAFVDVAS